MLCSRTRRRERTAEYTCLGTHSVRSTGTSGYGQGMGARMARSDPPTTFKRLQHDDQLDSTHGDLLPTRSESLRRRNSRHRCVPSLKALRYLSATHLRISRTRNAQSSPPLSSLSASSLSLGRLPFRMTTSRRTCPTWQQQRLRSAPTCTRRSCTVRQLLSQNRERALQIVMSAGF